jgi:MYXO-CTERM domain-containing protein
MAATLRDVLTTSNAKGAHGYVAALASEQIDQLVAYLQQIDDDIPTPTLPFEPPRPEPLPTTGGQGGAAGGPPIAGTAAGGTAPSQAAPPSSPTSSCALGVGLESPGRGAQLVSALTVAGLAGLARRRRRRRPPVSHA